MIEKANRRKTQNQLYKFEIVTHIPLICSYFKYTYTHRVLRFSPLNPFPLGNKHGTHIPREKVFSNYINIYMHLDAIFFHAEYITDFKILFKNSAFHLLKIAHWDLQIQWKLESVSENRKICGHLT